MNQPDFKEYTDEETRRYAMPSRVLWMIYAALAATVLLTAGAIQTYKYTFPEAPIDQFARAVDALNSGEDAIAHRLFKRLAENGNPAAEYWLADMKEFGLGTAKNLAEAVTLLQASAEKGFLPAELRLGELYLAGTGIDPNYKKAIELLSKAAISPNAKAQRLLGQMYAAGLGQPSDPFMAAVYFTASAINGDQLAISERDRAKAQLTAEKISSITVEMAKLGLVK